MRVFFFSAQFRMTLQELFYLKNINRYDLFLVRTLKCAKKTVYRSRKCIFKVNNQQYGYENNRRWKINKKKYFWVKNKEGL